MYLLIVETFVKQTKKIITYFIHQLYTETPRF